MKEKKLFQNMKKTMKLGSKKKEFTLSKLLKRKKTTFLKNAPKLRDFLS